MDNKLRERQLMSLSKSSQGEALKDWLNIEIAKLENVSLISDDNFEAKARSHKDAAKTLRKLIRYLDSIGKRTSDRGINQYI